MFFTMFNQEHIINISNQSISLLTVCSYPWRGFATGGYKCECKQGYEYPFEDPITYYDGQLVEAEFISLVEDKETRYIIVS